MRQRDTVTLSLSELLALKPGDILGIQRMHRSWIGILLATPKFNNELNQVCATVVCCYFLNGKYSALFVQTWGDMIAHEFFVVFKA